MLRIKPKMLGILILLEFMGWLKLFNFLTYYAVYQVVFRFSHGSNWCVFTAFNTHFIKIYNYFKLIIHGFFLLD